MDEKELKEMFRELEEQGWEPMLCDTPVPYFENAVMCGTPNDIGDILAGEMLMPKRWVSTDKLFITTVQGDSMIDANIDEGDKIFVEETNVYNDGDIVLVTIDGEYTLKSFCRDEDGNPWLIPQNAAYPAFQLHEHENVRVNGVVRLIIKQSPQVSFRSCMKKIKAARQMKQAPKVYTKEDAGAVIKLIAPEIKKARQWFAVFRACTDKKAFKGYEYDEFCEMIHNTLPNHPHLPTRKELLRMDVKCFTKPIALWTETDAPVGGTRFDNYKKIGEKALELFEQL